MDEPKDDENPTAEALMLGAMLLGLTVAAGGGDEDCAALGCGLAIGVGVAALIIGVLR